MNTLFNHLQKYLYITEGGAAGHMSHPFDYIEFTLTDIKELINDLFNGKVEDITEKVDGTNIQATVNSKNEVVFIRNKNDLNNINGGMYISDMIEKWSDKPDVADTFVNAGKIITTIFNNIPNNFFNPDEETKITVNCECMKLGKTNIIPYIKAQVHFHNLWVYKLKNDEWIIDEVTKKGINVIDNICKKLDNSQITPKVIIQITDKSLELNKKFINNIEQIFKKQNCGNNNTIEDYKISRFKDYCNDNLKWILSDEDGFKYIYNRWFECDKSINIRQLKNIYQDNADELVNIDKKEYKHIVSVCMEPLDIFFLDLGNNIIDLCTGIINQDDKEHSIKILKNDMEDVVKYINNSDNDSLKSSLSKQLNRLSSLNNKINPTEGIVFDYKGKIMKLTGSFAPLNQILGTIKYSIKL